MIDDYENDFDMEISIGSSLPDIELDEDVNYLREKQRKRWESSQIENFKRKLFFSNFQKILLHTLYCTLWHSTLALFRKKRFLVNLKTKRNASKFAMFMMEKENPCSFFFVFNLEQLSTLYTNIE